MHWNTKRHLFSFFVTAAVAGGSFFVFRNTQLQTFNVQDSQTRIFLIADSVEKIEETSAEKPMPSRIIPEKPAQEIPEQAEIKNDARKQVEPESLPETAENQESAPAASENFIPDNPGNLSNPENSEKVENPQPANIKSAETAAENAAYGPADQSKTVSYRNYVLKKIESNKSYPPKSRFAGESGSVKVELSIFADGKKFNADVIKSCGFEALDSAALKAVEKSAPFKKLPSGMQEFKIIFTMNFTLD